MATSPVSLTAAGGGQASAFTMSLTQGWDRIPDEQGGRRLIAGDLIMLIVRRPLEAVTGPPGWTRVTGNAFYRIIGDPWKEQPPAFRAPEATEWEIEGWALAGADLRPLGDDGTAGPWMTTPAG